MIVAAEPPIRFTAARRVNPGTCPVCGVRDVYTAEVIGVTEGIVWLCRHCGDGWIDLAATLPTSGSHNHPRKRRRSR